MGPHLFIMQPAIWLGEGKIVLSMVEEELLFFTRWKIGSKDLEGRIECTQEIQVRGLSETMTNQFVLYEIHPTTFAITLENHAIGKLVGTGIINDRVLGWEFRATDVGFEGLEYYEIQEDLTYRMHAEYATSDEFRTTIEGKIWQQIKPNTESSSG